MEQRRIGIEQEFFLVDGEGAPSDRADEFLARCREKAGEEGLSPDGFVGEVPTSMVEINTALACTVADLAEAYLASLDLALRAGRELVVRLYPLSTYPLPIEPTLRGGPDYEFQARTIGHGRFLHAARCTGVHLHLELPEGTLDPDAVVFPGAGGPDPCLPVLRGKGAGDGSPHGLLPGQRASRLRRTLHLPARSG